ncbi:MAG TPA: glycosyltransferase, partial [Bryobacteraceae bacterium]|nr:glycosyltransferase [Bryobacteraceae bacterium]
RTLARRRDALSRVTPISLGIPDIMLNYQSPARAPENKDIDVFFAGRIKGSSTVRERGAEELAMLSSEGMRIAIHEDRIDPSDYLDRCARAWLVWAPEGYGWDCFRAYEAALVGSLPLLSRQTIERYEPLIDGEHAIYYDIEPGQLAKTVRQALQQKSRLTRMSEAARAHVLKYHTPRVLAQHVAHATLNAAHQMQPNATCE